VCQQYPPTTAALTRSEATVSQQCVGALDSPLLHNNAFSHRCTNVAKCCVARQCVPTSKPPFVSCATMTLGHTGCLPPKKLLQTDRDRHGQGQNVVSAHSKAWTTKMHQFYCFKLLISQSRNSKHIYKKCKTTRSYFVHIFKSKLY
jgi:hypothetical protein